MHLLTSLSARRRIRRAVTLTWRTTWTQSWNIAKFVEPLTRRRMHRLRAPLRRQCLIRRRRLTVFFGAILLYCARWICFPNIPFVSWRSPRTLRIYRWLDGHVFRRGWGTLKVWDSFCSGRLGIFGPPEIIQLDEGGERKNEIWMDLWAARRIKLQFQ